MKTSVWVKIGIAILIAEISLILILATYYYKPDWGAFEPFLKKIDGEEALKIMTAVSAAIVAVGFTLDYFIADRMLKEYPQGFVGKYLDSGKISTPYVILIGVIIISVIIIILGDNIEMIFVNITALVISSIFIISLLLFIKTHKKLFKIMNVTNVINELSHNILKYNKKKTSKRELNENINYFNGIIINSISKNEIDSSFEGIRALVRIMSSSIEPTIKTDIQIDHTIMNGLTGMYFEALNNNDPTIFYDLVDQMSFIISLMGCDKNYEIAMYDLLGNDYIKNSIYFKILENSIETKKYYMADCIYKTYIKILRFNVGSVEIKKCNYKFVNKFINEHIYQTIKYIIEKKDIHTFKDLIKNFRINYRIISSPEQISQKIIKLINDNMSKFKYDENLINEIIFQLKFNYLKDFENILGVKKLLDNIKENRVNESIDQHNEFNIILKQINRELLEFYISNHIHGMFFEIGSYLMDKELEAGDFMDALWHYEIIEYTTTLNNNIRHIPISTSINWLTFYTFHHRRRDDILSYDGRTRYELRFKYYVITMCKLNKIFSYKDIRNLNLNKPDKMLDILKSDDIKLITKSLEEIRDDHKIIKSLKINLTNNINMIKLNASNLKKQNEQYEKELISKCRISENIINKMKSKIIKNYEDEQITNEIADIKYDPNLDPIKYSNEIKLKISKKELITSTFKNKLVHIYNDFELIRIYDEIKNEAHEVTSYSQSVIDDIKSILKYFEDNDITPDAIFLPNESYDKLYDNDEIEFSGNNIIINDVRLFLINNDDGLKFNDLIIFEKSNLQIIYKNKNDNNLIITYNELDDLNIEFNIKNIMHIRIIDPDKFAIIDKLESGY